jgi:sterol desaturase/sphingolipid hydroxylase (fatty acid hydroxylase superfamily)
MLIFFLIIANIIYFGIVIYISSFYKGFNARLDDTRYVNTVAINIILTILMSISVLYLGNFSSILSTPLLKNIVIAFLAIDTLHFWQHYMVHHTPFIKNIIHSTHHTITDLLPLDSIFLDNIDYLIFVTINLFVPFMFIDNCIEYLIIIVLTGLHSSLIHSDITIPLNLPIFIDAKFHGLHHSVGSGNYSVFFPFWDDFMGTRIKETIIEKSDKKISMDEFNTMCKNGKKLTVINNLVINCEEWIHMHPGGKTMIEKLIGKDSTKEFNEVHGDSSVAKNMLNTLKITEIVEETPLKL